VASLGGSGLWLQGPLLAQGRAGVVALGMEMSFEVRLGAEAIDSRVSGRGNGIRVQGV